jgi:hypothetical protein
MEYQVALVAHREVPRRWWRRRRCACGVRWGRCPDAARPGEQVLPLAPADGETMAVRFDDVTACGVRVESGSGGGSPFIAVQVVTRRGEDPAHDLTRVQAGQLRDVLADLLGEPSA